MAAEDVAAAVGQIAMGAPVNGIIEVAGPEQFRLNEFVLQARLAKLGFSFLTHRTEERLRKSNLKSAKLVICVAWLVPGCLMAQAAKVTEIISKDLTNMPGKGSVKTSVGWAKSKCGWNPIF
jgi:hypothetical protein